MRSRRFPNQVPPVRGVFDVEHYQLRAGGEVLFFRNTGTLDEAFTNLFTALGTAGWVFSGHRAAGRSRAFAGCVVDCERQRFYAQVEAKPGGQVVTVVRLISSLEFERAVPMPGECTPVGLAHDLGGVAMRYMPVYEMDLDLDGQLDVVRPRLGDPAQQDGDSGGETNVVFEAMIMRGECGHLVGTFDQVPAPTHFAAQGKHGLVDLVVRERGFVDGRTSWVPRAMHFDGERYVPTSAQTPAP